MNEEHADEVQTSQSGGKKTSILWVLLAVAIIGGLLYVALPPREPSFHGKSLGYWLEGYAETGAGSAATKDPKAIECREAIRHIGTNAIPFLMRMLRTTDPPVKLKLTDLMERQNFIHIHFSPAYEQNNKAMLGFYCLDDLAISAVPALVDTYNNPPSEFSKHFADWVLMAIYPASSSAIPYWVPPQERAEWYYDAGQAKSQWGDQSNAILSFSEAIRLNPTNGPAYFIRAAVKIDLHDFPGASGDVRKSIELGHTNDTAFYFRGLCEFGLKDFTNAESDATTAIDMNTNNADAYDLRGLARGTLRKLDAALDDFNQAVALAPKEAVSYRNRALVEGAQKDYELALADVSKSIQLDAKDGMAYLLRGRIKTALKDYKAALPDFDQAIALNPKDATAYSARGTTRVDMDDFQSATADLEKALQLDPKSVVAYLGRGWLKAKLGGADDETLADFERAVALGGQSPETTAILAAFQYGFSKWVPALQNCRKALELGVFGSTADTMRHYIWLIRTQKGEMTDANMELETYLKSPQGAKAEEWEKCIARFLLGNLTESNFLSQATTTAKRPSAVSGQVCDSLYYAGMKRKLAGDKQGAVAFFQKCLDTTNDNSFAYMNAKVEMRSLRDK